MVTGALPPQTRCATYDRQSARVCLWLSGFFRGGCWNGGQAVVSDVRAAAQLVATKTTRQPVETVEAILTAHHNGDPLNRIAASLGVHHSAVKRVLEAAEGLGERRRPAAARSGAKDDRTEFVQLAHQT